jgi:uncharacterized membrane protein YcjF (UPF0283 family)
MRKLLLILFIWTSFYFYFPAVAIAEEGDQSNPPQQRIQQQMQRIHRAQNELDEQRHQLEMERQELEHQRDQMQRQRQWSARKPMRMMRWPKPICLAMMVMCLAVNILVAVWVFQDIRTRGTGSGIWIVIALLAGLLGVLVYAVVRLGDIKQS